MTMPGTQQAHLFEWGEDKRVRLPYLLYLPKEYNISELKRVPLLLFLHGAGGRGDDLELVKRNGLPQLISQGHDYPFIVVSPQCPERESWRSYLDALKGLIDEIIANYTVDTARIYLTGISMGGYGAWALAIANPNLFAAVVPICGGGDPDKVCTISHVPVWAFHGAKDTIVPPERTQEMVESLKCCDGNVQFTIYPEAGHDSWTETYNNPALYAWLLQHIRTTQSE